MTTLLLITADRLVRADFRGRTSPRLVGCWEQARGTEDSAATLVELALALGPRRVRGVWLLTTEATTNVLPVARDILAGSGPEDLAQLLAFEAESLTGQAAFENTLSHVSLPTTGKEADLRFWITQTPSAWQSAAEEAVRRHGGRLLGIAHPAGVAAAISPAASHVGAWRRLELWDDLAILRHHAGDGATDVEVMPQARTLDGHFDEVLIGHASGKSSDEDFDAAHVLRLTDQNTLERWLTEWATTLSAPSVVVPLQRIPKPPMTATQRRSVMVACAAAMMLFCGGWYWLGQMRLKSLAAELEKVQAPARALEQLKQDETKLAKERDDLQKQAADVRRDVELLVTGMTRQSERQSKLLASLSQFRDEHFVVQKIESQAGETHVLGLCLRSGCVQSLARKLARELHSCGWQVSPAELTSKSVLPDGGPWTFKIVLKDLPSNRSQVPTKENKVAKR